MPNVLSRTTLAKYVASTPGQPTAAFDRIHELAYEIFPHSAPRAAFGVSILFNELENTKAGYSHIPAELENDQLEDYLVGYIVKAALHTEAQGRFDG
jgi:hypothetical protein